MDVLKTVWVQAYPGSNPCPPPNDDDPNLVGR
jgi:hypothetical protein